MYFVISLSLWYKKKGLPNFLHVAGNFLLWNYRKLLKQFKTVILLFVHTFLIRALVLENVVGQPQQSKNDSWPYVHYNDNLLPILNVTVTLTAISFDRELTSYLYETKKKDRYSLKMSIDSSIMNWRAFLSYWMRLLCLEHFK